jgi:uroporphyrinogen-III synthase
MPLAGKRVVITRPEAQTSQLITLLREAGAIPIIFPTITIVPITANDALDLALSKLHAYDWVIFTSANSVRVIVERMAALGLPQAHLNRCQVAVIGPATAAALADQGVHVDLQPHEYVAEAIFEALAARGPLAGRKFLLLRADIARAALREQLAARGAIVEEIPVYRTVCGRADPAAYAELRGGVDVLTFTSSSTVRYFFEMLGGEALTIASHALVACIGPITAQTARGFGLRVDLVANEYTVPGLLNALMEKMSL